MRNFSCEFETISLSDEKTNEFCVKVRMKKIAWFTVIVPLFGFIFCITWSMVFDFSETTNTDCNVYNFLPSVSAAIGRWEPQKFVWKSSVGTQATCRILFLYGYWRKYHEETVRVGRWGLKIYALVAYIVENVALVTLSYWDSTDNYGCKSHF